jgi:hypothetical protein
MAGEGEHVMTAPAQTLTTEARLAALEQQALETTERLDARMDEVVATLCLACVALGIRDPRAGRAVPASPPGSVRTSPRPEPGVLVPFPERRPA